MPKKLHLPAPDVLTCQFQDDVSSYPSLTVQSSWSNSPRLATWHLQFCLYRLPIAPRRDGPLLVGPLLPVPWPDSWFRCQAQPHNRRIKGTYSTWRYKSVRLPTGAPREQQLHSTYHLRGSVSLVKPSVNSKKLFALKRIDGGIWSFNVPFVLEGQRRLAWCYIQRCILSHAMRPLKNTCQKTFHPMQHSFLMMKDTIIPRVRVQHALLNKILHFVYWKTKQYSQLKPDERIHSRPPCRCNCPLGSWTWHFCCRLSTRQAQQAKNRHEASELGAKAASAPRNSPKLSTSTT